MNIKIFNQFVMDLMFDNSKFDGDVSAWYVSRVKYRHNVFRNCPIENKMKNNRNSTNKLDA